MPKNSRLVYDEHDRKRDNKDKSYHIEQTKILWMPISIGQNYHESNYLAESLDLITKNFKHIDLVKVIIVDA
ncbi:MAG: hypothetical protein REH83_00090, partial [Rickettsiella sp.]|nr:hypothetical protein [Rickettsiella sp.]